jgi:hypothetical protein
MLSPNPRNDWCYGSQRLVGAHLSDGCKVGIMQPSYRENWGAKPTTDDWLDSRPMQQCIGEEPGEFKGSLSEVILSEAPRIVPEMQGNEENVHRLGRRSVGSSDPKRRGPHWGYEIVSSAWRHAAAPKGAVPASRTGMNGRQHDHERGGSSLEKLERLDSWAFREQSLSKNQVNSVELPLGQYRAVPRSGKTWEGVTVRSQDRRAKWSEMPGSTEVDEEMTYSAWQHAAAERRLKINELQRMQGSAKCGLIASPSSQQWLGENLVNCWETRPCKTRAISSQARRDTRRFNDYPVMGVGPSGSKRQIPLVGSDIVSTL